MLERVSPGPIGFEHRLFECSKCNHVELDVIASDPFTTKAAGLAFWRTESAKLRATGADLRKGLRMAKPHSEEALIRRVWGSDRRSPMERQESTWAPAD